MFNLGLLQFIKTRNILIDLIYSLLGKALLTAKSCNKNAQFNVHSLSVVT